MIEPKVFDPKWPEGLIGETTYGVLCDDKGRDGGSWLRVYVATDGDVHVALQDWEDIKTPDSQPTPFPHIRVRTFAGGGRSHRTHQALLWLADAIRRDNEENKRDSA